LSKWSGEKRQGSITGYHNIGAAKGGGKKNLIAPNSASGGGRVGLAPEALGNGDDRSQTIPKIEGKGGG